MVTPFKYLISGALSIWSCKNNTDLRFGKGFLDMTLKAWATEEKNKLDFIKIKNFCASKDTIKKMKKTIHRKGENICKSSTW